MRNVSEELKPDFDTSEAHFEATSRIGAGSRAIFFKTHRYMDYP